MRYESRKSVYAPLPILPLLVVVFGTALVVVLGTALVRAEAKPGEEPTPAETVTATATATVTKKPKPPRTVTATVTVRAAPTRASRDLGRQPSPAQWAALRRCESTDRPGAVSENGLYHGLYQFDIGTWRGVGGTGLPSKASRAEQDHRAALLYADRGAQPWPRCGRYLP